MMGGQPSFLASYLAPLANVLDLPDLFEIPINPDGRIWMERKDGAHIQVVQDIRIERDLSVNLVQAIASSVGVRFSDLKPTVLGRIMFCGIAKRAQVMAPPVVECGMARDRSTTWGHAAR